MRRGKERRGEMRERLNGEPFRVPPEGGWRAHYASTTTVKLPLKLIS